MEEIYHRFGDQVAFVVVYVQEAHPTDGWQVDSNVQEGILYRQHQSFDEREAVAQACSLDLHIPLPIRSKRSTTLLTRPMGPPPNACT
jgi:Iodothyronine deiodinase